MPNNYVGFVSAGDQPQEPGPNAGWTPSQEQIPVQLPDQGPEEEIHGQKPLLWWSRMKTNHYIKFHIGWWWWCSTFLIWEKMGIKTYKYI